MDKYIDNMLAEEMDLIVLTTDSHRREGVPGGGGGGLVCSYRCMRISRWKGVTGKRRWGLKISGSSIPAPRGTRR